MMMDDIRKHSDNYLVGRVNFSKQENNQVKAALLLWEVEIIFGEGNDFRYPVSQGSV